MKATLKKNDIKEYLQQIEKLLNCSTKSKKRIIYELENNINEYIVENTNSTISDIIEHFGTPEDISSYYLSTLDEKELNEKLKKAKTFRRVAVLVGAAIVLIFIAVCIVEMIYNKKSANRNLETGIVERTSVSIDLK